MMTCQDHDMRNTESRLKAGAFYLRSTWIELVIEKVTFIYLLCEQ
jgi:hypothetical protein